MTDTQLDSILNQLPNTSLPSGLRDRTLLAFDRRKPGRRFTWSFPRFSWKWTIAAVILTVATVGAFENTGGPHPHVVFPLADGDYLESTALFRGRSPLMLFSYLLSRTDTELRNGRLCQVLTDRVMGTRFGYCVKAQPRPDGGYDLGFSSTDDPGMITPATMPTHTVIQSGALVEFASGPHTGVDFCLAMIHPGHPTAPPPWRWHSE